jgi:hypothetical protein
MNWTNLVPNKIYYYTIRRGFDSSLSNTIVGKFRCIRFGKVNTQIIIDESYSDNPSIWTNSIPFEWLISVKSVVQNIEALYIEDIFMEDKIIVHSL